MKEGYFKFKHNPYKISVKKFTFRKFAGLEPTIFPKNNFFAVVFQGFSLLLVFSRNTFEWLLPNFCFTCLCNTNKKR